MIGSPVAVVDATDQYQMLHLAVVCPHCGKRPRLRVSPEARERWRGADPEQVVISYACHGFKKGESNPCQTIYKIRARSFQLAE